jgi:hypothetical protein
MMMTPLWIDIAKVKNCFVKMVIKRIKDTRRAVNDTPAGTAKILEILGKLDDKPQV